MLKFIKTLLAITAYNDYKILQMDIKIVFLNKNLRENVYMTQLESFEYKKFANKVCNL
jgi:hypothetical protein